MSQTFTQRDREITRTIHRLFWKSNLVNSKLLWICVVTRFPAMLIYNVLIPIVVAYALQAIVTKQFEAVTGYALAVMLLTLAYCVLWAIGGVAICKNGEIGVEHVQKAVFTNYLGKDYEFYSNTYLGALGAQATRVRDAYNEYNQLTLIAIPKQIIVVGASIAIIAYYSPLLALVTLAAVAGVLSFTVFTSKWRLKFRRRLSEASSELSGVIGDALGHGSTVKSFAAEPYEEKRLGTALKSYTRTQYISWMSSIPADVGRMILAAIATGATLLLTARLYQQGSITIAIVILVQLYVIKLVTSTLDIAEIIKTYEATMGGVYQAIKTMLVQPSITDRIPARKLPAANKLDITFGDVTYKYDEARNGRQAVANFSLTIRPGEKIGLVGYSGSGKTTLTKLLMRFMDIQGGRILLGGVDIRDAAQHDLRGRIAFVPQESLLFHRSIGENISYGRPAANRNAMLQAAKAAYVDEFVADLPKGYDTLVGERGVKLSGGQRQRVAIARALLKDAPILVLDEATSALDSRSEKLIQKALWKLMKDRTALVIAHRLSTIQRMDRIAVMDKGKIVQLGTHQTLLKQKAGIYAKLWAHQSGGYVGAPSNNTNDGGAAA
jgi:ATP-binding cassette, subfamily B, bacterial